MSPAEADRQLEAVEALGTAVASPEHHGEGHDTAGPNGRGDDVDHVDGTGDPPIAFGHGVAVEGE